MMEGSKDLNTDVMKDGIGAACSYAIKVKTLTKPNKRQASVCAGELFAGRLLHVSFARKNGFTINGLILMQES
jgi:hypothetical protein